MRHRHLLLPCAEPHVTAASRTAAAPCSIQNNPAVVWCGAKDKGSCEQQQSITPGPNPPPASLDLVLVPSREAVDAGARRHQLAQVLGHLAGVHAAVDVVVLRWQATVGLGNVDLGVRADTRAAHHGEVGGWVGG